MPRHEVRTPLSVLSAAAGLLSASNPTPEQQELIELMEAGASHIILIVDDMLHFGQLESGKLTMVYESVEVVKAVVEPVFKMLDMNPVMRDGLSALRLTKSVAADVPETIFTDSARVMQVLQNLVRGRRRDAEASRRSDGVAESAKSRRRGGRMIAEALS